MADTPATITYDDFVKLDLRIAKVTEAVAHPNADKLLLLQVDLGPLGARQIVAGLREYYSDPATLVGKLIVIVANLAPRTMRGIESQGMLLAASDDERSQIITLTTSEDIAPGASVS